MSDTIKEKIVDLKDKIDKLNIKVNYTGEDMLAVSDYRASYTFYITTKYGSSTKCDKSHASICYYGLQLGRCEA